MNTMEGVETMHPAPSQTDDEIVRAPRINEGGDGGRNDRQPKIIWAAGFLDGEGCIAVSSNRAGRASRSLILSLQASQVNPQPLHRLVELFGGSIAARSGRGIRRDHYTWRIAGATAARALRDVEPHLTVKRQEAQLGLRFQDGLFRRSPGRALNDWENAERDSYRLALMEAHAFTWG
jgi:hypothetical protein